MGMHYSTSAGSNITRNAMAAELLDAETEVALARAWRDEGDEQALHRLVNAYLRLAISMAAEVSDCPSPEPSASAPLTISMISVVIAAWRAEFI